MDELDPNWLAAIATTEQAAATIATRVKRRRGKTEVDHRKLPRAARRNFKSDEALQCIERDFTGRADLNFFPLFGKEFSRIYRISMARFQRLMEDVMASGIQFYQPKTNRLPTNQAS
jgi:hypothetical protein